MASRFLFLLCAALAFSPFVHATQITAGFDLFRTNPERTHYGAIHFHGVPGACAQVGFSAPDTDTIVERLQNATPANPTVDIVARCLQLQSDHVAIGDIIIPEDPTLVPAAPVFATLQSDRGRHPNDANVSLVSPPHASTGTLTFTFSGSGGTFDSTLDVFFDIRAGSIDGPIIFSSDNNTSPHFTSVDIPWTHAASVRSGGFNDAFSHNVAGRPIPLDQHGVDAPAELIAGINFHMNGVDGSEDFYPVQEFLRETDDDPLVGGIVDKTLENRSPGFNIALLMGALCLVGAFGFSRRNK